MQAAAFTRARLDGKATRLSVRSSPLSPGLLPGWLLPAARLVSFDGVIGTMNQSDSRPQLERRLWQCLATLPRRRPIQRTRSGLFGSDNDLPDMIRSTTPAERRRLAYRRRTCCLRPTEKTRPPRSSSFRGLPPHPAWLLSTLRTPRYHGARKTRSRPARYGFGRMRLSLTSHRQLFRTHSSRRCSFTAGKGRHQ